MNGVHTFWEMSWHSLNRPTHHQFLIAAIVILAFRLPAKYCQVRRFAVAGAAYWWLNVWLLMAFFNCIVVRGPSRGPSWVPMLTVMSVWPADFLLWSAAFAGRPRAVGSSRFRFGLDSLVLLITYLAIVILYWQKVGLGQFSEWIKWNRVGTRTDLICLALTLIPSLVASLAAWRRRRDDRFVFTLILVSSLFMLTLEFAGELTRKSYSLLNVSTQTSRQLTYASFWIRGACWLAKIMAVATIFVGRGRNIDPHSVDEQVGHQVRSNFAVHARKGSWTHHLLGYQAWWAAALTVVGTLLPWQQAAVIGGPQVPTNHAWRCTLGIEPVTISFGLFVTALTIHSLVFSDRRTQKTVDARVSGISSGVALIAVVGFLITQPFLDSNVTCGWGLWLTFCGLLWQVFPASGPSD